MPSRPWHNPAASTLTDRHGEEIGKTSSISVGRGPSSCPGFCRSGPGCGGKQRSEPLSRPSRGSGRTGRGQVFAQLGAIVGFVAEHPFRRLHSANEALCDRAIVRFTSGQQDGDKAPFNICECVYLRVAPSTRAANSLLLLPPFPPAAERCAFTCVESIICVSLDRPLPASSRNRFSQTPRRAQRTKRL